MGWDGLFTAIKPLRESDLERIIFIRNEDHTFTEAINRPMMPYAYHIGQIVFLAKRFKGKDWISLSIPKGKSKEYNANKFKNDTTRTPVTDDAKDDILPHNP